MSEPTWQELWDRARTFEVECKARYDTDPANRTWHILGMSDAIAEQCILLVEGAKMETPAIDWHVIQSCGDCSERYGICGHHQKMYGIDWRGESDSKPEVKSE